MPASWPTIRVPLSSCAERGRRAGPRREIQPVPCRRYPRCRRLPCESVGMGVVLILVYDAQWARFLRELQLRSTGRRHGP